MSENEPVAELIAMLDAAVPTSEGAIFDHTPEEIGLHVMENIWVILAALRSPAREEVSGGCGSCGYTADPECEICSPAAMNPKPADKGACVECGRGEGSYMHGPFDDTYHEFKPFRPAKVIATFTEDGLGVRIRPYEWECMCGVKNPDGNTVCGFCDCERCFGDKGLREQVRPVSECLSAFDVIADATPATEKAED